jgi:Ser/Thr protein kinase RdoA (MazF antagonist)
MAPPPTTVTTTDAISIARRNGLDVTSVRELPTAGTINTVFALDDRWVLRVPRDHPVHVDQAVAEAAAIPVAVEAGVRTPHLIAYDDSLEVVPFPVLIVERASGSDVEAHHGDPALLAHVWEELGRDLGRLHAAADPNRWPRRTTPGAPLVAEEPADVYQLLDRRVADGWFSYLEADWIRAWLTRLGPIGSADASAARGDVQMSNVFVADGEYSVLVDWGCAAVKDPVVDFIPLPFAAVPPMLRGHREIAALPDDDQAERRIVLGRVHTLLAVFPRGAAPGMTWGERPTAWLTDLFRFFQHPPSPLWEELAPR